MIINVSELLEQEKAYHEKRVEYHQGSINAINKCLGIILMAVENEVKNMDSVDLGNSASDSKDGQVDICKPCSNFACVCQHSSHPDKH